MVWFSAKKVLTNVFPTLFNSSSLFLSLPSPSPSLSLSLSLSLFIFIFLSFQLRLLISIYFFSHLNYFIVLHYITALYLWLYLQFCNMVWKRFVWPLLRFYYLIFVGLIHAPHKRMVQKLLIFWAETLFLRELIRSKCYRILKVPYSQEAITLNSCARI